MMLHIYTILVPQRSEDDVKAVMGWLEEQRAGKRRKAVNKATRVGRCLLYHIKNIILYYI